jgi:hypothetical protein
MTAFFLKDGSEIIGAVLTGDPRSIVVQTDSGRVTLARSSVARTERQVTPARFLSPAADGADLRKLGKEAGRRAADNAPGGSDMVATCCATSACWPLAAPIASALAGRIRPVTVPPSLLAGATGEYAAGLTDGYVQRMTERRHNEVFYGIVGGGVVFTALVFFVRYEAAHMFDGFELDLGLGEM